MRMIHWSKSCCPYVIVLWLNRAEIQRIYRGFKGRLRAKARRKVFESDLGREAAAMNIERVFRGHKVRGVRRPDTYTNSKRQPRAAFKS